MKITNGNIILINLLMRPFKFNVGLFLCLLILLACQKTQQPSTFQLVEATSQPIWVDDISFSWLEGINSVDIDDYKQVALRLNTDNSAYIHVESYPERNEQSIHLYTRNSQKLHEEHVYNVPETQQVEFVSWSPYNDP